MKMSKESEGFLTSCDKCDAMQVTIESKMFSVIRDFSNFTKIINKEQSSMNNSINSTINTVNMIIDQLDENKAALINAENEIEKLKKEMQQMQNENKNISNKVQQRSVQFAPLPESQNSSFEISSIKAEVNELKKNFSDINIIKHDINCLKYEVKKIKRTSAFPPIPDTITQVNNEELVKKVNELKIQIDEMKSKKSKKKISFAIGKKKDKKLSINDNNTESKYYESSSFDETETDKDIDSTIIDKLNIHQNNIDSLRNEIMTVKENSVSQKTLKNIKKQIKKLSKRTDDLEQKRSITNNTDNSEEEDTENKENEIEIKQIESSNIYIKNLTNRVSLLESKTNEISNLINQPRVHQIFVDLPKTKACNLLFRTPNELSQDSK